MSASQPFHISFIGGAGPLAHAELVRRLVRSWHEQGCQRDEDYPVLFSLNQAIPGVTEEGLMDENKLYDWWIDLRVRYPHLRSQPWLIPCASAHHFLSQRFRGGIPWIGASLPKHRHADIDTRPWVVAQSMSMWKRSAGETVLAGRDLPMRTLDTNEQIIIHRLILDVMEGSDDGTLAWKTLRDHLGDVRVWWLCTETPLLPSTFFLPGDHTSFEDVLTILNLEHCRQLQARHFDENSF